jgi:hypothetical protein
VSILITCANQRSLCDFINLTIFLAVQVLPPKEQSRSETFIQRCIGTGIAYENLKENFIIAISGVNLCAPESVGALCHDFTEYSC